jgi:hypothetical protein
MPVLPRNRLPRAYILMSMVSVLALFFSTSSGGQYSFKRRAFGTMGAATLLVVVSFAGCSSGTSTSTASQAASTGTPSGVYTITITPTAAPSSNSK